MRLPLQLQYFLLATIGALSCTKAVLLFDCVYPFKNCEKDADSADNINAGLSTTRSNLQNSTITYTFTYTERRRRRNETTKPSLNQSEAMNAITDTGSVVSVMSRLEELELSTEGAVSVVNRAMDALANDSEASNTSTKDLIGVFDQALKYVEFMSRDEIKNFLHVSSNTLVGSLTKEGNAEKRRDVVVKIEEYAVTSAVDYLDSTEQNSTDVDFGSVKITFCRSGTDECLLESEDAAFESISASNLIVTFIQHNALENDPLPADSVIASASAQDQLRRKVSIPVTFTLKHDQPLEAGSSSCVFLNETTAEWSTDGCISVDVNFTHTTCFCNHTTNFAILFLHSSVGITKADEFWFNLMTYVGCGVSITALIATMAIFILLGLHRAERVILLWNLCFCLCSAQLILVAGTSAQVGTVGCKVIAILLHFFFTATFSWMLMEGVHIYMKASNVRGGRYKFRIILAAGWALPACIIAISMGIGLDHYGSGNACWLSVASGFVWAFIGPALGIILVNTFVLIFVIKVFLGLKSISKTSEKERIKKATKAVLFLMPLLGITWIFGLLAIDESTKWFLYLFCICNSLQGLSIFILQCAKNDDVRKAFFKKYRRTFVSVGSYSSGGTGSSNSNKTNDSYMSSDHPTKGLPTVAKW